MEKCKMVNILLIKRIIKKNQKLYSFLTMFHFLCFVRWVGTDGSKRKYPKVLQLPITYKCNCRCVMCSIWRKDHSNEMNFEGLGIFLKDPIFQKLGSVGINGGEPSLIIDLPKYIKEILNLPKLNSINIISNAINSKALLEHLENIYKMCYEKNIRFHISISLDGVGEIHNMIRGIPNAFKKAVFVIDKIIQNKNKYCDSIDIVCTVIKQNINHLIELNAFANKNGYRIKYRLGIENKRIGSNEIVDQYSVIYEPFLKQTAKEFFHSCMFKTKNWKEKYKYFSIFYFLNSKKPKRLLGCDWKDEGITMDSRGDIYYCAVASEKTGSLREDVGKNIFFSKNNIEYRQNIIKKFCDKCIHDYSGKIEFKNALIFLAYILRERFCFKIYKIKGMFL